MATIKSYTDLSQSRKLAEILPIESADMHYWLAWSGGVSEEKRNTPKVGTPNKDAIKTYWCPCWSLASLIGVLPRLIEFKDDKYYLRFMKEYVEYANDEISITGRCLHTTGNNNLVDACVEMIEKLHEQKLL